MRIEQAKKNLQEIISQHLSDIKSDKLASKTNALDLANFIINPKFDNPSPAAGGHDDERKKDENKNLLTLILESLDKKTFNEEVKKQKKEAIEAVVEIFRGISYKGDKKNKSKPIIDLLTTAKAGDKSSLALIIEAQCKDKAEAEAEAEAAGVDVFDYLAAIEYIQISSVPEEVQEEGGEKTIGAVIKESTGAEVGAIGSGTYNDSISNFNKYVQEKYNPTPQYDDELKISTTAIQALVDLRNAQNYNDTPLSPRHALKKTAVTEDRKNPSQVKTDAYIKQLQYEQKDAKVIADNLKIIRPTAESSGIKASDLDKKSVAVESDKVGDSGISEINPSKVFDELFTKALISDLGNPTGLTQQISRFC